MTTKVLCIDDEPMILKALKRELAQIGGLVVITAESGIEGLEQLSLHDVAIVISDLRMPVMDGLEVARAVRATHPDIVRVILTGHADIDATISAINDAQVYRFLTKPWERAQLAATMHECIGQAARLRDRKNAHLPITTTNRRIEVLDALEHDHPGISRLPRRLGGAIAIDAKLLDSDVEVLLAGL